VPLFPNFYDVHAFGVGQKSEGFLPLTLQSVALPHELSLLRLDLGLFRQEPAITELDWLFTPNLGSNEHMHVAPPRASTERQFRFTLSLVRSPGFGS
jgi:hypothetical protein